MVGKGSTSKTLPTAHNFHISRDEQIIEKGSKQIFEYIFFLLLEQICKYIWNIESPQMEIGKYLRVKCEEIFKYNRAKSNFFVENMHLKDNI